MKTQTIPSFVGCKSFYYRPQRSCGQGNVFTGVCLSTGGGGCLPLCMLGCHTPPHGEPPAWRTPPGMENPPGWRTPPRGSRLQHTVYERPVRILLECILVFVCFWSNIEMKRYLLVKSLRDMCCQKLGWLEWVQGKESNPYKGLFILIRDLNDSSEKLWEEQKILIKLSLQGVLNDPVRL